jgi:hypothetical protein
MHKGISTTVPQPLLSLTMTLVGKLRQSVVRCPAYAVKRYHGICIKIAAENYFFLFFKEEQAPYCPNGFRTLRASYALASDPL